MGKIYVGQTALTLTATVDQDVTGGTCLLKYKKPDGTTGSLPATIVTAATGVIEYEILLAKDIDQAGVWTFWGYVTFADTKVAAGESYKLMVYAEGD